MPKKRSSEDPQQTIEAEEIHPDAFASTPANRARAHKLRLKMRANGCLDEADSTWLAGYEEARAEVSEGMRAPRGASRARRVSYTEEEEEAASEGDTSGATYLAAGEIARQEGRRLDSMIGVSITAMARVSEMYEKMMGHLITRNHQLENAHIGMMNAYREHFLGRVEAEAELEVLKRAEDGDKDALTSLAEQLLPVLLQQMPGAGPDDEPAGK
jgi:hypothetical protein